MGELKTLLEGYFLKTKSLVQIHQEMLELKFNSNVRNFADKIESLLVELIDATIRAEGPNAIKFAENLHTKTVIQIFTRGLPKNYSIILKCRKPANLQEAINIALDEESDEHFQANLKQLTFIEPEKLFCKFFHLTNHATDDCWKLNNFISSRVNQRNYQTSPNYSRINKLQSTSFYII